MTSAVPVVDLENVQLEAVRAGARELGAVQVVNHRVPAELSEDLGLFAHANVWPADGPGLREAALAYMAACRGLAENPAGR